MEPRKYSWETLKREQMNPLIARQVIHAQNMTLARISLNAGAVVPRHSHPNEQVTVLLQGRLQFRFDNGRTVELAASEILEIPPNEAHEVVALEDSVALDLFSPPRHDWQRGEDQYLRGGT